MNINAITNYIMVSERIASSGQPVESQFKDIAQEGYQVVINLAMPDSDNAIPEEGNIVTKHKMVYVHIPVPFDAPSVDHLRKFFNVMTEFSDKRVWVHCVVNYRVSAFLFLYQRLVHGMATEEAGKVMLPGWQPNDVWKKFMQLSNEDVVL